MKLSQTWDLDCFSKESSPKQVLETLQAQIEELDKVIEAKADIKKAILTLQNLSQHYHELSRLIVCLNAQDVTDSEAHFLQDQVTVLGAQFANTAALLDEWLKTLDDQTFHALLEEDEISPIAFGVSEKRRLAKEKLPAKEEAFINDFAVDGFHGWPQMWDAVIGNMTFPFEEKKLSFSQIENEMADPNREKRQAAFKSIDAAFREKQLLFAQTLNHLAGFRLAIYEKRGWDEVLKEPLEDNRMHAKTLHAMWSAIEKHREKLKAYMKCKADLLGLSQLEWYDLEAPIGEVKQKISFEDAAAFIIKHFNRFSPKMGAFAQDVLEDQWIDAEDRKNKYPGGFCVGFPVSKQSRIFMTYAETMTNLFTLAHELGHAYHNFVTCSLPGMAQDIRMNVAETASTMAEITVTRAAIQEAKSKQDKLFILDDHLSRSVAYLMNIYARFLFETRFYEARKKGFVAPEELNTLMEEAQKEAYGNALGSYHPLFWAAKMHFQLSETAFYNFPYTFGYLFSLGIHELGSKQEDFEGSYIALLEDTGQMTVESLAQKHLKVDLTKPDFWEMGLKTVDSDIDIFLELAKE
ncbi:M3 family oligoendopeptidase [Simkania sp.]|uniref:M3 family oligoendopeptidase n=1 Tax=Simkania sp. TaxID=34094 RepID=UPI003B516F63